MPEVYMTSSPACRWGIGGPGREVFSAFYKQHFTPVLCQCKIQKEECDPKPASVDTTRIEEGKSITVKLRSPFKNTCYRYGIMLK
jgi:hypothetical protein